MNTEIREKIEKYADEIRALRENLHRHPELGNSEYRTAGLIEDYLQSIGLETRRLTDTAVAGFMKGAYRGRTAALRADMDALPLTEMTGASFTSLEPGVMHACGHDVHMAAVLGAARILADMRDTISGNVVFLFEPDEEGRGGAQRMIAQEAMKGVDAVFGAHVDPDLPVGKIGVRYGKFYAASDMFMVKVTGVESHGAEREKGTDALAAAAEIVNALLELPRQVTDERCVLTVGRFSSGTACNIMPGYAEIEGIIRTLGKDTRYAMKEAFFSIVEEIASRTGTHASIEYIQSYPGIVNEDGMTALAEHVAASQLGAENVCRISEPTMTTEDFGYLLDEVPGTFYHIGAGSDYPLHNPKFLPQNEAAVRLAEMHAAVITQFLGQNGD